MKTSIFEKRVIKKLKNAKNKSVINLYINNEIDLYNKYSYLNNDINNNPIINNDIIDYLTGETENISFKNSLLISIKTVNTIFLNSDIIEKLIKENIYKKLSIINRRIKRLNVYSVVLALIGMLLIGITQISEFLTKEFPVREFIIVMSWVFMWKAVDIIFFEKTGILKSKRVLMKIYFSEITLENAEN